MHGKSQWDEVIKLKDEIKKLINKNISIRIIVAITIINHRNSIFMFFFVILHCSISLITKLSRQSFFNNDVSNKIFILKTIQEDIELIFSIPLHIKTLFSLFHFSSLDFFFLTRKIT